MGCGPALSRWLPRWADDPPLAKGVQRCAPVVRCRRRRGPPAGTHIVKGARVAHDKAVGGCQHQRRRLGSNAAVALRMHMRGPHQSVPCFKHWEPERAARHMPGVKTCVAEAGTARQPAMRLQQPAHLGAVALYQRYAFHRADRLHHCAAGQRPKWGAARHASISDSGQPE